MDIEKNEGKGFENNQEKKERERLKRERRGRDKD